MRDKERERESRPQGAYPACCQCKIDLWQYEVCTSEWIREDWSTAGCVPKNPRAPSWRLPHKNQQQSEIGHYFKNEINSIKNVISSFNIRSYLSIINNLTNTSISLITTAENFLKFQWNCSFIIFLWIF